MTDFLGTDEFEARLGTMRDDQSVQVTVGQLRGVGQKLARQASQIEFLEGEVYTKEGRWPRYLWTGWECGRCGYRTHETRVDCCPQCGADQDFFWNKVFWQRDDAVETAVAQQHVEIRNREKTKARRPVAVVSLYHHIEQGHEGSWGECDFDCCMEAREEAAGG